jgi:hypothetical protein
LLRIIIFVLLCSSQLYAKQVDLFAVDEQQMNADFKQLNALEDFVLTHEGVTLEDLKNQDKEILHAFDDPGNFQGLASALRGGETPLGIPPFIWGFCLGIVGLVLVAVLAEDRDLTKKALYGCLVSGIIWAGIRITLGILFY